MSEQKAGDWLKGADGKNHQIKECNQCKKLMYFGDNPKKGQPNEKDWLKLNLDGTPHVDERPQGQRAPQKPRERFTFEEFITEDGKTRRLYSVQREGFVGELNTNDTFSQMQQIVWKFRAAELGNPKTVQKE